MHAILIAILLLASVQSEHAAGSARRRAVKHPSPEVALPNAAADSYSLGEGSVLTIAAPGVLANDTLNGATIASFGPATGAEQTALGVAVQTAHGGSLSLSAGGGFTYTPANAFSGTDTFKYVIRNAGGSSSASVTIVVSALQAAAVNDSYTTPPESPLSVPAPGVLTNDTLGGGRIASFGKTGTEQTSLGAISSTAQGGTIALRADGSFSYVPPPTVDDGYGYSRPFLGFDTFVYAIRRDSIVSTATVNVAVEAPSVGADYVVTSPGHFYSISGLAGENPVLQLTRGRTYTFQISASPEHPFAILDAPPGSVTNNNITSGIVTFTVPMTAQNYRYRCTTHLFGNVINTVP